MLTFIGAFSELFSFGFVVAWLFWTWKLIPPVGRLSVQLAGFPWIFQQVSLVCPGRLQYSHHSLSPHWLTHWSLEFLVFCPHDTRAKLSTFSWTFSFSPSITFLCLSSLLTSKKTSFVGENGSLLKILPYTSSSSLFRPAKNPETLSLSIIFFCFHTTLFIP